MTHIEEPFGPIYPDLGVKVAKLRSAARNDPSKRKEHGEAVLAAINSLNRQALNRVSSEPKPMCASGTAHNKGAAILKAVKAASLARALAPSPPRSDELLREMYESAMAAKRAAAIPPIVVTPDMLESLRLSLPTLFAISFNRPMVAIT
jgi:hypothetical protein